MCSLKKVSLWRAVALRKAQRERDKWIISTLRAKLKSKPTVCVLNQKVKRKDLKIEQLKEKSINSDVENLKRKHQVAIKKTEQTIEKEMPGIISHWMDFLYILS